MTFIAGVCFIVRGVLAGFAAEAISLDHHINFVEPILSTVFPDVVPIICIVAVLLPIKCTYCVCGCFRPAPSLQSPPTSHALLLPMGTLGLASYGSVDDAAVSLPHATPPMPTSPFRGLRTISRSPAALQPVGSDGVIALY